MSAGTATVALLGRSLVFQVAANETKIQSVEDSDQESVICDGCRGVSLRFPFGKQREHG